MIAHLNPCAGTFEVHVDPEVECLRAPDEDGEPRQWLPCQFCGELHPMPLGVVSFFCDERCAEAFAEEHPIRGREIPGYSHACGYHD